MSQITIRSEIKEIDNYSFRYFSITVLLVDRWPFKVFSYFLASSFYQSHYITTAKIKCIHLKIAIYLKTRINPVFMIVTRLE